MTEAFASEAVEQVATAQAAPSPPGPPVAQPAPLLDALAGELLPGDGNWPSAATLGLSTAILALAELVPAHAAALDAFLADPPPGLLAERESDRVEAALAVEQAQPELFAALLLLAYNAYYTDPRVLAVIEGRTGYRAGPPLPAGHLAALARADPPDTVGVAARGPLWRDDGTDTAARVRAAQACDPDRIWTEEEIAGWLP